jgi:hypothetical protein
MMTNIHTVSSRQTLAHKAEKGEHRDKNGRRDNFEKIAPTNSQSDWHPSPELWVCGIWSLAIAGLSSSAETKPVSPPAHGPSGAP